MIELPAAKVIKAMSDSITIAIPESHREAWLALVGRPTVKKSRQLYVKIDSPRRPRTTGHRSQNTHAWGHAQQIGETVGYYKEEVMQHAKELATTRGYPSRIGMSGAPIPISEQDASTTDMAIIIDVLHEIASFSDVTLKEYRNE